MLIVNLSVWESIEALHDYSYKTVHAELIKQRRNWFSKMENAHLVLWWIPAGHIPSVEEAKEKLAYLQEHAASPLAFTFSKRYTIADLLAVQS